MFALSGAASSALLGAAITTTYWALRSPDGAARALRWGVLHGVLIGVAGLVTGVVVGLSSTMLAPRSTAGAATGLGAAAGAAIGGGLAAVVGPESNGGVVAVAAVATQLVVGALLGRIVRARALGWQSPPPAP